MLALKIVGLVLLCLAAVMLLLLLLRVRLRVFTKSQHALCVELRVLFLRFTLLGGQPKKESSPPKRTKKQGKLSLWQRFKAFLGLPASEQVQKLQSAVQKNGAASQLRQIAGLLKPALQAAAAVLKKLRVQRLRLNYTAGGEAAEAAVSYGLACAVLYPLCELVQQLPNAKKNAVQPQLQCNYNAAGSKFLFELAVSVRVVYLAAAGVKFLKQYFNQKQ